MKLDLNKKYTIDEVQLGMTVAVSQLSGIKDTYILLGNARDLPEETDDINWMGDVLYKGVDGPSYDLFVELSKDNQPLSMVINWSMYDGVEIEE